MENTKFVYLSAVIVSLGICFQLGCAPKKKSSSEPAPNAPEKPYGGTHSSPSNPLVINGHAEYHYLKPSYQVGAYGLTLNNGSPFVNPIRRAEVRINDSSGALIDWGETDDNGDYSITIQKPSANVTVSIEVNSRGLNGEVAASILDKAASKNYYSVKTSLALTPSMSSATASTLVAGISDSGGAFSILDKILQVNKYLRGNSTNASCSICQVFTVAPKVTVYWIRGFNPASYLGETSGLSFFDSSGSIDSTPSLYILGGDSGDADNADTDHFDESVIIHEYGHFLEKNYWKTDSPGGYHNGNLIIDPRLAFSEGFANFLPAAVTGKSNYIDTIGSPYGVTKVGVYLDFEDENYLHDKIIVTNPIGEGVYREVSVSRVLYDYLDSNSDLTYNSSGTANATAETANIPFSFIWLALTNDSFGMKSGSVHFPSIGHFNLALNSAVGSGYSPQVDAATKQASLATARIGEVQALGTGAYAQLIGKSSSSCVRTMTPVNSRPLVANPPAGDESYYYHDLFSSSDFFRIDHPGGSLDLNLTYNLNGSSTPPDLDLYVYKESHVIGDSKYLVGASDRCRTTTSGCALESPVNSESISSSVAAGTYLVLVNVVTSSTHSGSSITYELKSGGQSLCDQ